MQSSRDRHAHEGGCASVLGAAAPVFSQRVRPATFKIKPANMPKRTAEIPSAVRIPIKSERPVVSRPAIGIRPKKLRPKTAETRPRNAAGARSCTMVLARPKFADNPTARIPIETAVRRKLFDCDMHKSASAKSTAELVIK